ncbi:hypothetical protein [Geodermatophilus sabuli]|uniref:Uncharacterized protein n=1 Tax=Geodermatophilus sabuli TaxID=1564158 RepID=A0A285EFN3_9ACTN|nr:hypothetical protein [Geodermatophilus sabuli]MBB3082929.1 hypothetical protein [Geodermatophilus sabuli]SNX97928.1 hypothetical protein SAMN06893097_1098 [Geodermatophilus sabuli]
MPEWVTDPNIAEFILNYQGNNDRFDTWLMKIKEGAVAQAQLDTLKEQRTTLKWQKASTALAVVAALLAALSVLLQVLLD